jgi:hypothetical protein
LAAELVEHHYDPAYARARARDDAPVAARLTAAGLSDSDLPGLADRLVETLSGVPLR